MAKELIKRVSLSPEEMRKAVQVMIGLEKSDKTPQQNKTIEVGFRGPASSDCG